MQAPDQKTRTNDRRKYARCSVYGFMHATATLFDSASIEQTSRDEKTQSCTGLLADISRDGAQIIMPGDCQKYLKEHQHVTVRIKTTFLEKMDTDVAAQVKYIVPGRNTDGLQVGVEFANLQANPRAQAVISRICEYGRKLKAVGTAQAQQMASAEN